MDAQTGKIKRITSPDNSMVKDVFRLKQKKYRDKEGRYLIEGPHLILEALKAGIDLPVALVSDSYLPGEIGESQEILEELNREKIRVVALPDPLFQSLAETQTPQGIISIASKQKVDPEFFFSEKTRPETAHVVILDRLQDPGNVGTVLRTADAAGFSGLLIVKGTTDIYSPKVVRSAAGSLFRLPVLMVESAEEALDILKERGFQVAVSVPKDGLNLFQQKLMSPLALAIGNEGFGVSDSLIQGADLKLQIPMYPGVESLNAAAAAAIMLFEVFRQRLEINRYDR